MSNQKTINKLKENIIEGKKNFIGTKPLYCDIQDSCKMLSDAVVQYNKVVEQNQSLQKQILWQKERMEKDNQYLIKLEEANMLFEQDVEILKRQVESLKAELRRVER